jgi:hypothetical protein
MHRRLKDALRTRVPSASWLQDLLWVLLGIRSTPNEDSGITAAEAVFGSKVTVPGEFLSCPEKPDKFLEELKVAMSGFKLSPVRHNISSKQQSSQKQQLPQSLEEAKMVFMKNDGPKKPLAPLYNGAYMVLDRNPHYFTVQLGDRVDRIAVSRLQPAFVPQETQPVQPPLRGRPRKVTFQCCERSATASESESWGPCRSRLLYIKNAPGESGKSAYGYNCTVQLFLCSK